MSKRTATKDVFDRLAEQGETAATPTTSVAEAESDEPTAGLSDERPADDESADGAPPRRRFRRLIAVVGGLVFIAALGSSAFLGWRIDQVNDTTAASRAALEVARNYAVTLTTLDANDIDNSFKAALDGATGEFKDAYSQGSSQLRQILVENNAAGTGTVIDAAVKSATKTKVDVLLFVDQSITNTLNPSPRIDRNRIQMTMELVDNRWLASKVDII